MKLSYAQARECVIQVYNSRGWYGGYELTEMLSILGLISLNQRAALMQIIVTLEQVDDEQKRQSKFGHKILKKLQKNGT